MLNTENGCRSAQPVPLGAYTTVSESTAVSDGERIVSAKDEKTLAAGTAVQIVEIKLVQKDQRVRGRLSSGGWISLFCTQTGYRFAQPVPVGVYTIIADSAIVGCGE